MRLSRETKIELMAWADGELPDEARERVTQLLESSEDARQFVERFRALDVGAWASQALQPRLSAVPSITDAVMARIEARERTISTIPSRRLREERQRMRSLVISVTTGLAVAASLALYFRWDSLRNVPPIPIALLASSSAVTSDSSPGPGASPLAVAPRGVEVNDIDALSHAISVFEIPMGAAAANAAKSTGPSSVVIWIDEDRNAR
ncbi:MAG: hypothetical protein ABTD50_04390 [Polyangiaceae bacterium]|jgi:hypothetical protein